MKSTCTVHTVFSTIIQQTNYLDTSFSHHYNAQIAKRNTCTLFNLQKEIHVHTLYTEITNLHFTVIKFWPVESSNEHESVNIVIHSVSLSILHVQPSNLNSGVISYNPSCSSCTRRKPRPNLFKSTINSRNPSPAKCHALV